MIFLSKKVEVNVLKCESIDFIDVYKFLGVLQSVIKCENIDFTTIIKLFLFLFFNINYIYYFCENSSHLKDIKTTSFISMPVRRARNIRGFLFYDSYYF